MRVGKWRRNCGGGEGVGVREEVRLEDGGGHGSEKGVEDEVTAPLFLLRYEVTLSLSQTATFLLERLCCVLKKFRR